MTRRRPFLTKDYSIICNLAKLTRFWRPESLCQYMSLQAQFCMTYMQYVIMLGQWTWATTQPAVQTKTVGASTMTPGETHHLNNFVLICNTLLPACHTESFKMHNVQMGHLYWQAISINLELLLMITLHLPTPQRDSSLREPASDQSSLCAVLPAQQQHHHHQCQEIDPRLAEPGSQSEQFYLQCP